ncbi:MAG: tetraacyldisaccharide 4'-kinase, partial [Planctomycetes bacterium]|nr:tetraacyldisaccharide 4'-kinase [Planctomycetota bacterium]
FQTPLPSISIGNLVAGGSGKTPLSVMLTRELLALGQKPAILLRGYRQTGDGYSDEAELFRRLCPEALVEIGANRLESARRAARCGATILLLDDGFQHLRMRRDLDIVLIDATSPWGGGNCLPGGLLREPRNAIEKAGAIVITRSDQREAPFIEGLRAEISALAASVPIFSARHRPARLNQMDGTAIPLDELDGRDVVALSGIARPEAFEKTLADLGARVVDSVAGRDHHHFNSAFLKHALVSAAARNALVVTTEKDRAKQFFPNRPKEMNGGRFWCWELISRLTIAKRSSA